MGRAYATGTWTPYAGQEEAFVAAWRGFVEWAMTLPGAGRAVLTRDARDPARFVSFSDWESLDAMHAWKASPDFKPQMSRVQQYIDKFAASELEEVESV